jgi:subtilase family serine protease
VPAVNQPAAGTPAYLQQAYDLSWLSQNGGRGDTVAIVDAYDDPTAESDLATFRSTSGLAACTTANGCFRKVNENGAASLLPANDKGWEEEISLDLDAVSGLPRVRSGWDRLVLDGGGDGAHQFRSKT